MSEPLPAKPRTRESAKSQTKTHLPRFKRAAGEASSSLPRLLLQERDCAILQDVARYRLLTTSQIETLRASDSDSALRFPSRLTLTRRLKLLFHHGYVQRIARPLSQGSLEPVYVLHKAGVKALQRHFGDVDLKARTSLPKSLALEHLLSVNEFRVSLEVACRASDRSENQRAELMQWQSGEAVKFAAPLAARGERTRIVRLIPDGFFALRSRGQRLFYFLEADRGTESLPVLVAKCRAYYAYWQSGGFGRDFSLSPQVAFRVLFVLHSARRLDTMSRAVTALPHGQKMLWMTTEEEATPHRVLEPVFTEAGSETMKALR